MIPCVPFAWAGGPVSSDTYAGVNQVQAFDKSQIGQELSSTLQPLEPRRSRNPLAWMRFGCLARRDSCVCLRLFVCLAGLAAVGLMLNGCGLATDDANVGQVELRMRTTAFFWCRMQPFRRKRYESPPDTSPIGTISPRGRPTSSSGFSIRPRTLVMRCSISSEISAQGWTSSPIRTRCSNRGLVWPLEPLRIRPAGPM